MSTTPVNGLLLSQPPARDTSSRSSEGEKTWVGDGSVHGGGVTELNLRPGDRPQQALRSPSQSREQASRLEDDLELLRAEKVVFDAVQQAENSALAHSKSSGRARVRRTEPADEFDIATNPLHEKTNKYQPPENPTTNLAKIFKRVHRSSFLVRYFFYIIPLVVIFLIPLLLGALVFKRAAVGGVRLFWFSIWLEIVWLTLWAGRIVAKCLPYIISLFASIFTNNSKKWKDLGRQLEVAATVFFWWLAILVSFLPTMRNNHLNGSRTTLYWEKMMNKVITAIFAGVTLNLVEKLIIQLIAMDFHLRTYSHRIDVVKFQIGALTKLYQYSKSKITMDDSEFEERKSDPASGTQTPMHYLARAQKNMREAASKMGDVAGRVAQDFTGREVSQSTHPHQVVLTLLRDTNGSQVLARRLYRTFARPDTETVCPEDLKPAFESEEEAEAAFQMFDKDLNGDVSMEELEAVCVEIGRERKSITNALKDMDSVVSKLDKVFFFIVVVVTLLILLTLVSTSTASVLASAGSTMLALSWLFSATAQEFLQSVIFVFVKHPFDVGDRVSVYGNTGASGKGDDYYVKAISLLYTEFKKLEGHVVQAPNSYLNTLFILNMRRSGGLAEGVPIIVKFGTTLEQIDALRQRLLDFVLAEKREYQGKILTELREVVEAHAVKLNVVFFYKSNWQNELLRLQRRNKFICALMVSMLELGIEGPRMRYPGQKESSPFYLGGLLPRALQNAAEGGRFDGGSDLNGNSGTTAVPTSSASPFPSSAADGPAHPGNQGDRAAAGTATNYAPSTSQSSALPQQQQQQTTLGGDGLRRRGESASAMSKRVDFSLGMRALASGDLMAGLYDDPAYERSRRIPASALSSGGAATSTSASGSGHHLHLPHHNHAHGADDGSNGSGLGRTTSREAGASAGGGRSSVDSQGTREAASPGRGASRHRLFSRHRRDAASGRHGDGGGEADLESGGQMPDIAETSGGGGANGSGRANARRDYSPSAASSSGGGGGAGGSFARRLTEKLNVSK